MTALAKIIGRLWDTGKLTTAEIAKVVGYSEAHVSRIVSEHVNRKALERRKEAAR